MNLLGQNIVTKDRTVYFCFMVSKSDITRQHIIEKSAPIFNTKGYSATSLNDLIKATGLTKGGIYGHFESKDDIATATFEYAIQKVKKALSEKVQQEKTAKDKLLAILSFHHNYSILPIIEGGCPLLNTAIEADDHLPFLKIKAQQALQDFLDSLAYIFQKGIDSGEFRSYLDTKKEANFLFSVIQGGLMMSKLSNNPKILNDLLENLKSSIDSKYII